MQARPHAGIAIEQSRCDAHRRQVGRLAWRDGTALAAEFAEASWRGLIAGDRVLAGKHPKMLLANVRPRAERCACQLAAVRAMAMRERQHFVDFEANAAAQTASRNH